uniref:Uncharacterized protein n=1 Tax=Human herpesvirus 2 TaxID=10310 RepID=A0A481TQE2_HHV2|nr:hypothetical protein [Human alphaherpesvirus 2]QBH78356.1 hypothetical protein [Human alphaherpesvirus 2]QBH80555.1 hypothetical protein [Human alphaherpesvirus 2]QBH82758.1 hypothetical protein [Human alphaherpesvirus 2]QBH82902.1 hypothetical protein [Human alphaherpesvirus 2]
MAMIRGHVRSRRSINASTRPSCCIVGEYSWPNVDMTSSRTSTS